MEFRVGGDAAQPFQIKFFIQMLIDMIQHPQHPGLVTSKRRLHVGPFGGEVMDGTLPRVAPARSTDLAVLAWTYRTIASSTAGRMAMAAV
ncbi:hypothetical protein GCM10011317_12920 [Niveispirillum cyanobacteriorum]|nr:hypothetical protein GCM10011317_12920 [Niveispirillum cyanobacteriorum]